jgi:hypothetical protein
VNEAEIGGANPIAPLFFVCVRDCQTKILV